MVDDKSSSLGEALVARMEQMTWDRIGELSQKNIRRNALVRDQGESLRALRDVAVGEGDSAIA